MEREIPYDLFEEYLQGVLEGEALEKFELQLKQDDFLKQELELYKSVRTAQNNTALDEFENLLTSVQNEYNEQEDSHSNNTKLRTIPLWRWAAVGLLLLGSGYLLMNNFSKPTPETLYAEYAKHEFNFQELSGATDLMEIQNNLKSENYQPAISLMDEYLNIHPNAADVKLAKGIALLESNQFESAKNTFTSLAAEHLLFQSEANWYLALSYLKEKNIAESLSFLNKIPSSSSRFSDAQKLSNALK